MVNVICEEKLMFVSHNPLSDEARCVDAGTLK